MKPSFGRVPNYPIGTSDFTSQAGSITRTVADSAFMLQVMAGPHHLDHTTLEAKPESYVANLANGIHGKRVAFSSDLGFGNVEPEVSGLVKAAVRRFTELGAIVDEVATPWANHGPELMEFFWTAHMTELTKHLPKWETQMDPGHVDCIRESQSVSLVQYQQMRRRKFDYVAEIHRWFQNWDFLVTPTAPLPSFSIEEDKRSQWSTAWLSWVQFLYPFNMSWNPAASVPCGFTKGGLPVGLQIVGKRFDDLGVLQA